MDAASFVRRRRRMVGAIERELGPFDPRHLRAMIDVPRERFVRPQDVARSADDTPLPLDAAGLATISAPHVYLLTYRLLDLTPGDALLELGTGSGYGAALAARIVGPRGRVITIEIDPDLVAWARRALAAEPAVEAREGDATAADAMRDRAPKAVATFAVDDLPGAWLRGLPDGGKLVAPVGAIEQSLVLVEKHGGVIARADFGPVRYVRNRSPG